MAEKIEGTFVLDGLIEGRLPDDGELQTKLRDWIRFARTNGLHFTLEVDGNAFSILADNRPHDAEPLGPDPAQTVREALDQMLELFTPPQRSGVFSTLRSSEYRKGEEVQTVYAVTATGFEIQERTVDADTTPPQAPLNLRDRVKLAVMGLGVAVVVLALASFIFDFGAMWDQLRHNVTPIQAEEVAIDASAYDGWLTVGEVKVDTVDRRRSVIITLNKPEGVDLSDATLDAAYAADDLTLGEKLALESLRRGYLRVELFDDENKLITNGVFRVAPLRHPKVQTMDLAVPVPRKTRPARIVFAL